MREDIYIKEALFRAIEKHPCWHKNIFKALAVIGEEFGELQQAVLQAEDEGGDYEAIVQEANQLGAMVVRFLLKIGEDYLISCRK